MSSNKFWHQLQIEEKTICHHPLYKMVELINQLLHKDFPNLSIDITAGKHKQYCLMLSAQDNPEHFEEVINLYRIVLPLQHFEVAPFRQRSSLDKLQIKIDNQNFTLTKADILVSQRPLQRRIALTASITKEIPDTIKDHAKILAAILLKSVLGEYEFATRVNQLRFIDPIEQTNALPLTDFTEAFNQFWQTELGHTGQYPLDITNWQWVDLETQYQHDGVTDIAVIRRNESANSLVAYLDFCYRLELAVRVDNSAQMEKVFVLETQINEVLLKNNQAIYCQNLYTDAIRYMSWYVTNPEQAFEQAENIRTAFSDLDSELITDFDPTWGDYLRWVTA